jgi:hypothetical protein
MAKKQLVRLTESDLHNIINESVRTILSEKMDEGWWDTAKSFMGQYGKRGADKAQQMGQQVGSAAKNAYNTASNKAQQMGQNVANSAKNAYNTMSNKAQQMGQQVGNAAKNAYNTASNKAQEIGQNVANDVRTTYNNAKQDGNMKSMQKAFQNFKDAVEKFKAAGGKVNNQLASRISGIDKMMAQYQSHF